MNEITLSNDLNVITAEINSYKQVAGQSIFEIGRRLKHVKENDLVHGEWETYCNEQVKITPRHANRYIKVVEELGSNQTSMSDLGINALYQIATLPQEEREKEHTLSSGETKTVDDMTGKELQEVKRQLKIEQKERERLEKENEKLANQKPIIQEKEVIKEVIPDRVKTQLESTKRQLDFASRELEKLEEYKKNNELKKGEFNEEEAERERRKLMWEAEKEVLTLTVKIDKFLKEIAVNAFMTGAIASSTNSTKKTLKESIDNLSEFVSEMKTVLSGRIEI